MPFLISRTFIWDDVEEGGSYGVIRCTTDKWEEETSVREKHRSDVLSGRSRTGVGYVRCITITYWRWLGSNIVLAVSEVLSFHAYSKVWRCCVCETPAQCARDSCKVCGRFLRNVCVGGAHISVC